MSSDSDFHCVDTGLDLWIFEFDLLQISQYFVDRFNDNTRKFDIFERTFWCTVLSSVLLLTHMENVVGHGPAINPHMLGLDGCTRDLRY